MKRLLKDQLSTNGFTSEMDNNLLLPLPLEPCIPNHDMFSMARKQHMGKKPLKKTIAWKSIKYMGFKFEGHEIIIISSLNLWHENKIKKISKAHMNEVK